jgi:ubiquinol-cytochrome c reductase cytochrome b subunit
MGGYFLEYNNFIPADPLKTPRTSRRSGTSRRSTRCCAPPPTTWSTCWCGVTSLLGAVLACPRVQGRQGQGAWAGRRRGVALLKTFDAKFWGVVVMGGAVVILFFLPWLDRSPVKSIRYRPSWHKYLYGVFVVNFVVLGYLGIQPPSPIGHAGLAGRHAVLLRLLPADALVEPIGEFKPVPDRVTFKPTDAGRRNNT